MAKIPIIRTTFHCCINDLLNQLPHAVPMNTPRQSLDLSNVQLDFNQFSAGAIIEEDEEEHPHQHTPASASADPTTAPSTVTSYDLGDDETAHDNDIEEVIIDEDEEDEDDDDDESPVSDESVPNPDQPKRKFLFAIVEEDEEEEIL